GGWGTSSSGVPWVTVDATSYLVSGGVGIQRLVAAAPSNTQATANFPHSDIDATYTFLPTVTPTGNNLIHAFGFRRRDGNNQYFMNMPIATSGIVTIELGRGVAGVFTTLATQTTSVTMSTTVPLAIRVQAIGSTLRAKVWLSNSAEPTAWNVTTTDTSFLTGTSVYLYEESAAGNTNTPPVQFQYDNLVVSAWNFSAYEIQRMDTVDTTWQTIM